MATSASAETEGALIASQPSGADAARDADYSTSLRSLTPGADLIVVDAAGLAVGRA